MSRPALATINLDALRHNCRLAAQLAPHSKLVAVVKADAYGHGAVPVAQALQPLVRALAVTSSEEALELRQGGIQIPILLLEGPFAAEEVELAHQHDLWLMLHDRRQAEWILQAQLPPGKLKIWLKADTGMHRLGMNRQDLIDCHTRLLASGKVDGPLVLATHFAAADQPDCDATIEQWQQFCDLSRQLPGPTSVANSAAMMAWPELRADLVRPGIMLYGSSPFADPHPRTQDLQPVMSLTSRVIALRRVAAGDSVGYGRRWTASRQSDIATIAIGYGDGYPRHAPSGTPVLVDGHRALLAGTVSMDMITVDVTGLQGIGVDSPVELWGENLSVDEVATCAGTIGYELLTRMPARTPRKYLGN